MIERIRFKNFKALKDAEVKLGLFNLVVGPNGSGKSSLLQGIEALRENPLLVNRQWHTLGDDSGEISVEVLYSKDNSSLWTGIQTRGQRVKPLHNQGGNGIFNQELLTDCLEQFKSNRVYALEPSKMSAPVPPQRWGELSSTADNLAGALTHVRDRDEESYNHLRQELQRWLPEFDSIIFKNDLNGYREFYLRQASTRQDVPARELSEGTLLALALLTIIYQPAAPTVIGLEEPDRGLHPRLLREVRDALYRLSFPTDFGLKRKPVQVIATTHSPLFLDLFKDHPEQIIIAEKNADGTASFRNLADDKELIEMIGDTPLGEVWYSGVLGGVPALK